MKAAEATRLRRVERALGVALIAIYLAFTAIDIAFPHAVTAANCLKFLGVLLCAAYAVYERRSALLIAAMAFTLCADVFLLFRYDFLPGIAIFIGAQTCHALRFAPQKARATAIAIGIVAACAAAIACASRFLRENAAILIAAVYAFCLFLATARAYGRWRQEPSSRASVRGFFGMLLFVGCDVCVALYNAAPFFPALAAWPDALQFGIQLAIWSFYLPSQFLLCRSAASASRLRFS